MQRKFWMVLGSGMPVCRHYDMETARREAERLARIHSGQEFVVLEAIAAAKKTDIAWEEFSFDEEQLPF